MLLEAAAAGKPLIATNIPGCREIVKDNETGLLIPVRDSLALFAAVKKLVGDRELRLKLGNAGHELVKSEFDINIINNQTIDLYKKVIANLTIDEGKKKIIYFVAEDWYFWSHRRLLAVDAQKAGYSIYVMTRISDFSENIKSQGFTVMPVNIKRTSFNLLKDIYLIFNVTRTCRRVKPDIIHNIAIKPITYGTIAAYLSGVPNVINTFTGLGEHRGCSAVGMSNPSYLIKCAIQLQMRRRVR